MALAAGVGRLAREVAGDGAPVHALGPALHEPRVVLGGPGGRGPVAAGRHGGGGAGVGVGPHGPRAHGVEGAGHGMGAAAVVVVVGGGGGVGLGGLVWIEGSLGPFGHAHGLRAKRKLPQCAPWSKHGVRGGRTPVAAGCAAGSRRGRAGRGRARAAARAGPSTQRARRSKRARRTFASAGRGRGRSDRVGAPIARQEEEAQVSINDQQDESGMDLVLGRERDRDETEGGRKRMHEGHERLNSCPSGRAAREWAKYTNEKRPGFVMARRRQGSWRGGGGRAVHGGGGGVVRPGRLL